MLTDAEIKLTIQALGHYADYLSATGRESKAYREIITKLQQPAEIQQAERKAPGSARPKVVRKPRAQA